MINITNTTSPFIYGILQQHTAQKNGYLYPTIFLLFEGGLALVCAILLNIRDNMGNKILNKPLKANRNSIIL